MSWRKTVPAHRWTDDRGATALIVAAGMVLFLGMAALAVDFGLGLNERRQDQAAADTGVMAGALQAFDGPVGVRDQTLDFVRSNLETSYSDAEWSASWAGCSNPDRTAPFVPVPSASGGTIDCLSIHPDGRVLLRIPDQLIATAFGRILGVDTLATSAGAQATLAPYSSVTGLRCDEGQRCLLPIGLLSSSVAGDLVCLSRSGVGPAPVSCDRAYRVEPNLYGNPEMGTPNSCSGPMTIGQRFIITMLVGFDHPLFALNPNDASQWRLDNCVNPLPNQVTTAPAVGSSTALWEAFIDGGSPSLPGERPILRQPGSIPTRTIKSGIVVDDRPLWSFLDPANTVHPACNPLDPAYNQPPPGDPVIATARMQECLGAAGPAQIFLGSIVNHPRFALVPRFHAGGTTTIAEMTPVYIHSSYYECGGGTCAFDHTPGFGDNPLCPAPCTLDETSLHHVSLFPLPRNSALVDGLMQGPNGALGPFQPRLSG